MNKLAITEADLILAFRQGWKPCSECIEALLNTTENPRRDDFSISCSTVNAMSPSENESDNESMNDWSDYFPEDSNLAGSWVEYDKLYGDVSGPFRLPPPWNPIPFLTENYMLLCVLADRPPAKYSDCSCDGPVLACCSTIYSSNEDACDKSWHPLTCCSPFSSRFFSQDASSHPLTCSPFGSRVFSKDVCDESWHPLTCFPFSSSYFSQDASWHPMTCSPFCSSYYSKDACDKSWHPVTCCSPFSSSFLSKG
eukprot:GHVL01044280.1.p1 GENE.GHVL01044280.1~~GHVL01044280.1.p1  ORF type:complete len:253 (-),score=20.43 GHVL01044280.1:96-854(-)